VRTGLKYLSVAVLAIFTKTYSRIFEGKCFCRLLLCFHPADFKEFKAQQIFKFEIFAPKKIFLKGPDNAFCGAKLSCTSVCLINQNVKPDKKFQISK